MLALALVAAAATVLAGAPAALANAITPENGPTPNANAIHTLYVVTLAIAIVIMLLVEATLVWCLVRYRARKGAKAAQIHGNTRLEIGWTVGAAVILVVLAAVTFALLPKIDNPPNTDSQGLQSLSTDGYLTAATTHVPKPPNGKALRICVTGRQYIWRYEYAPCAKAGLGAVYAYTEMVVPTHTVVVLDVQSTDVDHSWWIPKLGGKFDAIPGGYHNYTWFKIDKPGVYRGQCAELCGRNHADMRASVRAVSPAQFEQWLANQKRLIQEANKAAEQQRRQLQKSGDL